MTKDQEEFLRNWTSHVGAVVWALSALSGLILLGYEFLQWLETGQWQALPVSYVSRSIGMLPDRLTLSGLRSIATWLTNLPLFLWLIFAPALLFAFASCLVEEYIEKLRRAMAEG